MTTQEPVPNLDELWQAYHDEVARLGTWHDAKWHGAERKARRALITAIEAPWGEALRGLVESMPQVLFWKSKLTEDSMIALQAYYVHVEEARALIADSAPSPSTEDVCAECGGAGKRLSADFDGDPFVPCPSCTKTGETK